jgi:parallel beta-helix repeat protein
MESMGRNSEIYLEVFDSVTICNNTIRNSNDCGIKMETGDKVTITRNIISNNNGNGIQMYRSLDIGGSSSNVIISNNSIFSNKEYGIYLTGVSLSRINGNLIFNNNNGFGFTGNNLNIFENSITGNHNTGINALSPYGNKILRNNIYNNSRNAKLNYNFLHELIWHGLSWILNKNTWEGNYWGAIYKVPQPIYGNFGIIPWINYDWHPAQEPYDIPIPEVI